jgi:hypothetical protein
MGPSFLVTVPHHISIEVCGPFCYKEMIKNVVHVKRIKKMKVFQTTGSSVRYKVYLLYQYRSTNTNALWGVLQWRWHDNAHDIGHASMVSRSHDSWPSPIRLLLCRVYHMMVWSHDGLSSSPSTVTDDVCWRRLKYAMFSAVIPWRWHTEYETQVRYVCWRMLDKRRLRTDTSSTYPLKHEMRLSGVIRKKKVGEHQKHRFGLDFYCPHFKNMYCIPHA